LRVPSLPQTPVQLTMEKRQREDDACGVATRRIRRQGVHRVLRERSQDRQLNQDF